jgi:hypothetical protein
VTACKVDWPLVPFKTLGTSNIDRGGSLDDLRRVIIVKTVRSICGNWKKSED